MELQDSPVDGGVVILHQLHEGKHEYEVKRVLKKRKDLQKFFIRNGDKLRLVNDTDVQDVPPEDLAKILSEGNPKLTVHKMLKKKEPVESPLPAEDVIYPVSKEHIRLSFSLEMMREGDPEEEEEEEDPVPPEEDICTEESEMDGNFLVVTMKKTSISVITGRSCDTKDPCRECHSAKCEYNDIVMVTESSKVTLVSRGTSSFQVVKNNDAEIEHMSTSLFMKSLCSEVYVSDTPERITIYYYKSNKERGKSTRGLPVVLNFSGSESFLKCSQEGDRVLLSLESCDKQRLKRISLSDQGALAYVFYMKGERTRNTTFESALHTGWFIRIRDRQDLEMVEEKATHAPQEERYFYVIILKS